MTEIHQLPDPATWPDLLRREYRPPDWAYWCNLADTTLDQMVCLSLNLDPHEFLCDWRDPSRGIKTILALSKFHSRLDIAENNAKTGALITSGARAYRVSMLNFAKWANGLHPPWELPEQLHQAAELHDNAKEPVEGQSHPPASGSKWPWGDYEGPLLRILAEAVNHFCLDGPDRYPKKYKNGGEVVDWIMDRMKANKLKPSKSLASAIETLISPRPYVHHRQRKQGKP